MAHPFSLTDLAEVAKLQLTAQWSKLVIWPHLPSEEPRKQSVICAENQEAFTKEKGKMDIGRPPAIPAAVSLLFCKIRINIFALTLLLVCCRDQMIQLGECLINDKTLFRQLLEDGHQLLLHTAGIYILNEKILGKVKIFHKSVGAKSRKCELERRDIFSIIFAFQ